jgi:hypothetical protein
VDVDVDQQLLIESAGGDSLPNVPLSKVPLPNVPLPEAHADGSVGEESTSPRVAEEAMFVAFRLGSGSCLSCSFPLYQSIYLRHLLLHASRGLLIAQGLFYLWVLYWFYFYWF